MKDEDIVARIQKNPKFVKFVSLRNNYSYVLTTLMMIAYFGFILLVAFNKPLLSQKIGDGVTTLGMPLGVAVIIFTIIITWVYIRRANSEFDSLTEQIVKGVVK